jgi:hypothetical protein
MNNIYLNKIINSYYNKKSLKQPMYGGTIINLNIEMDSDSELPDINSLLKVKQDIFLKNDKHLINLDSELADISETIILDSDIYNILSKDINVYTYSLLDHILSCNNKKLPIDFFKNY